MDQPQPSRQSSRAQRAEQTTRRQPNLNPQTRYAPAYPTRQPFQGQPTAQMRAIPATARMPAAAQPLHPHTPRPAAKPAAARMPKAQAQALTRRMKKGLVVSSVAAFGVFVALAAGHTTGVSASSSTTSSSASSSTSSNSSSSNTSSSSDDNGSFFGSGSSNSNSSSNAGVSASAPSGQPVTSSSSS